MRYSALKNVLWIGIIATGSCLAAGIKVSRDVPGDAVLKLRSDLDYAKSLKAIKVSPLHEKIFGPMGIGYLQFLDKNLEFIAWYAGSVPKGVGGFVKAAEKNKKTFYLTSEFLNYDLPPLYRIGLYLHESRHTEVTDPGHRLCPDNYKDENGEDIVTHFGRVVLSGKPGCDVGYSNAYGITVTYYLNILHNCENCSEKVKMDAEIFAEDSLNRLPLQQDKKALLDDIKR